MLVERLNNIVENNDFQGKALHEGVEHEVRPKTFAEKRQPLAVGDDALQRNHDSHPNKQNGRGDEFDVMHSIGQILVWRKHAMLSVAEASLPQQLDIDIVKT